MSGPGALSERIDVVMPNLAFMCLVASRDHSIIGIPLASLPTSRRDLWKKSGRA